MNMLTHTMSHRDYVDIHTHSCTLTKHTLICPQTQIQKHIHSHACTNTFIVSHKHADVCVCVCVCVSVLVAQSCPTLCDPMDCNCSCQALLSVGIRQARMLEWVARPPSSGSSWPRYRTQICHIAGGFFTVWATREALAKSKGKYFFIKLVL